MFHRVSSLLLVVSPARVELWRRQWRKGSLLTALDPTEPDFRRQLIAALERLRGRPIGLLLHLPDLVLQHETLPKASWLDSWKMRQSRFAFLAHTYDIAALFPISSDSFLFAGQPHSALLKTVLSAIASAETPVISVSHMMLEAFHLLPKAVRQQTGLAAMQLADDQLVLAHKNGRLVTARAVAASHEQIPQELQRTFQYLQRYGWSYSDRIVLTTLGLSLPSLTALPISSVNAHSEQQPWLEILAHAFSRPARFPLQSSYLQLRNSQRRIEEALTSLALLALAGGILLWGGFFAEQQRLHRETVMTENAMASLPPPLSITDRSTVIALDNDHALVKPLLANLPADNWQSLELSLPQDLRITSMPLDSEAQAEFRNKLAQLKNWQLEPAKEQESAVQIYHLTAIERDR